MTNVIEFNTFDTFIQGTDGIDTLVIDYDYSAIDIYEFLGDDDFMSFTFMLSHVSPTGLPIQSDFQVAYIENFQFADQTLSFDTIKQTFEDALALSKGTKADDVLVGTDGDDTFFAKGGDDTLSGGDGDDALFGEGGNDTIEGGAGDDTISGGNGIDTVIINDSFDNSLLMFSESDFAGTSYVYLSNHEITLQTADGTDTYAFVEYFQFTDRTVSLSTLIGSTHLYEHAIQGTDGDDIIQGLSVPYDDDESQLVAALDGDDTFNLGTSSVRFDGGDGNDTVILDTASTDSYTFVATTDGSVKITFYPDGDIYGEHTTGYFFNVEFFQFSDVTLTFDELYDRQPSVTTYLSGEAGEVFRGYSGKDLVTGGDGDDNIKGLGGDDDIDGRGGDDSIEGGLGNDYLKGGDGHDTISGGAGNDLVNGNHGKDYITGGDGNDSVSAGVGNDKVYGGNGNDYLEGGDGNDVLKGEDGNDEIYGDLGNDSLSGGRGADVLVAREGNDTLNGGSGDDYLSGGDGKDTLDGGADHDEIYGGDGSDTIEGGGGNDEIYGENGNDDISGDNGNDRIDGADGQDKISGGNGDDSLSGGNGQDNISGGNGNDSLYGGSGADVIKGGKGRDYLSGYDGNDVIKGGKGTDFIDVGNGRDIIEGGAGRDEIYLGDDTDSDTVIISNASDSRAGDNRDVVYEFDIDTDYFDFTAIDANVNMSGHQEFDYSQAELGVPIANGIWLEFEDNHTALISADVNGDLIADLEVLVHFIA